MITQKQGKLLHDYSRILNYYNVMIIQKRAKMFMIIQKRAKFYMIIQETSELLHDYPGTR